MLAFFPVCVIMFWFLWRRRFRGVQFEEMFVLLESFQRQGIEVDLIRTDQNCLEKKVGKHTWISPSGPRGGGLAFEPGLPFC